MFSTPFAVVSTFSSRRHNLCDAIFVLYYCSSIIATPASTKTSSSDFVRHGTRISVSKMSLDPFVYTGSPIAYAMSCGWARQQMYSSVRMLNPGVSALPISSKQPSDPITAPCMSRPMRQTGSAQSPGGDVANVETSWSDTSGSRVKCEVSWRSALRNVCGRNKLAKLSFDFSSVPTVIIFCQFSMLADRFTKEVSHGMLRSGPLKYPSQFDCTSPRIIAAASVRRSSVRS